MLKKERTIEVYVVSALRKHCMETVDTARFGFQIPIPLPADVKVGESWADAA